jgi:hypothetical protein
VWKTYTGKPLLHTKPRRETLTEKPYRTQDNKHRETLTTCKTYTGKPLGYARHAQGNPHRAQDIHRETLTVDMQETLSVCKLCTEKLLTCKMCTEKFTVLKICTGKPLPHKTCTGKASCAKHAQGNFHRTQDTPAVAKCLRDFQMPRSQGVTQPENGIDGFVDGVFASLSDMGPQFCQGSLTNYRALVFSHQSV